MIFVMSYSITKLSTAKSFNKVVALKEIGGTGLLNLATDLAHADFNQNKWSIAIQSVILKRKTISPSSVVAAGTDEVDFPICIQCGHSQNLERTLEGKLVSSWNVLATVNGSHLLKSGAAAVTSYNPPIFFPFDTSVGDSVQFIARKVDDIGLGRLATEVFDVKLIVLMQSDYFL